jgi:chromosome segregation ATPase
LTEATQFSTNEIKRWLENQTSAILKPVHTQAKKLSDDMNAQIQTVTEISKMLLDNSTKEIEKRNMKVYNRARALNKLAHLFLDRLKKLNPPEQISYDNLSKYTQETQKIILVTDIDIKNWFPRISPFFIMDRRKFLTVHERAKQSFNTLNDFVTKEYVKTKTLEETFQLISELQALERQTIEIQAEISSIRNERLPIEIEIAELELKIADLKSKGPIGQLNQVTVEIDTLNNELKHALRHLQKPFIKMQALATSGGGGGITPDELHKLNEYLEMPFEALVKEDTGYPLLKQVLEKLANLLREDTLKLKPDKARKAEQSLNEILKNDALLDLQVKSARLAAEKAQLLASEKMDETKRSITVFQEQVEQLKARKTGADAHEAVKEHSYNDMLEEIKNHKRAIEKNAYAALNKKVQII